MRASKPRLAASQQLAVDFGRLLETGGGYLTNLSCRYSLLSVLKEDQHTFRLLQGTFVIAVDSSQGFECKHVKDFDSRTTAHVPVPWYMYYA